MHDLPDRHEETVAPHFAWTSGLVKSGAADTPFAAQFLADPWFRLPPGRWTITVYVDLTVGRCDTVTTGAQRRFQTGLTVEVAA